MIHQERLVLAAESAPDDVFLPLAWRLHELQWTVFLLYQEFVWRYL